MSKFVSGKVRFSYCNAFEPREQLDGSKKYSTEIIIRKDDTATITALKKAMKDAVEKKWGGKPPSGLNNPLVDSQKKTKQDGSPLGAEYDNSYYLRLKSTDPIGVIDAKGMAISSGLESGDYGRISAVAYAYDTPLGKGISFFWNNAQLLEKGEPLGGGKSSANEDFGVIQAIANDFNTQVDEVLGSLEEDTTPF
jgi:hypothetical protein